MVSRTLELRDVCFGFEAGAAVLEGVSFAIGEGETLSVMGASGIGKTTLGRLIAGLITPTRGSILFKGSPVESPSSAITISFQNYPCFPWLSVEKNLLFGQRGLQRERRGSAREYALWLLDQVGLKSARNLYPRELSGGMLQRLSIARSLAVHPEILILDEPFSAVDPRTKTELKTLLHRLQEKLHFSLIVVLHNLDDAHSTGERALVLAGQPARICLDVSVTDLEFLEFERLVLRALSGDNAFDELLDAQRLLDAIRHRQPLPAELLERYAEGALNGWLRKRVRSDDLVYVKHLLDSEHVDERRLAISLAAQFPSNGCVRESLTRLWRAEPAPELRVGAAVALAEREDVPADVRQEALAFVRGNWDHLSSWFVQESAELPEELFRSEVARVLTEPMSRPRRSLAALRLMSRATTPGRRSILASAMRANKLDLDNDVRDFCTERLDAESINSRAD